MSLQLAIESMSFEKRDYYEKIAKLQKDKEVDPKEV
jgi:hypothetical protein